MDYLEYLGRRLVWLVVSLVVVIVVKRPRILKRLAIVSDVAIGKIHYFIFSSDCLVDSCHIFFILYLFMVVTFFLSWRSLSLNNVMEVILQTVLIIPTLYTLFVPHNEVVKRVDEFLSAKKE